MSLLRILPLVLALGAATPAAAANVFFEDFSYGPDEVLNATAGDFDGNWNVTGGSVDYLVGGVSYGYLCGEIALGVPRNCVDLDGSTGQAGTFSTANVFGQGRYTVTFQLTGNQRIDNPDDITITFGLVKVTFSIARNEVVASNTASVFSDGMGGLKFDNVLVGAGGTVLSFINGGGDNQGAILKTVTVDAVPLPAGGILLLLGALAGLGWVARRRAA